MQFRTVRREGLRRFMENGDTMAFRPAVAPRRRRILSFLQDVEHKEEPLTVPAWKAHRLVGDRKDVRSLSVTRNWHIWCRTDPDGDEIVNLNHEDYHQEAAMSTSQGIRMKAPAHPGGFVRSEIVEALGLTVTGAARALGVTRPALSALLNERAGLSPEMALRIEKVFGVSMDPLMRMQTSHDIARTREREADVELVPFEGHAT